MVASLLLVLCVVPQVVPRDGLYIDDQVEAIEINAVTNQNGAVLTEKIIFWEQGVSETGETHATARSFNSARNPFG